MKITLNIILIYSLICIGYGSTQVSLFNFNSVAYDVEDKSAAKLSTKISSSFIDLMKNDMKFINKVHFIDTKTLDKELIKVRKSLVTQVKKELENSIADIIPRDRITEIVNNVSGQKLNNIQLESLTDSLITLVSSSTKIITKSMLLSNSQNIGKAGEITIADLNNFIENIAHESIWKSTFSSLIASLKDDFSSDIAITGKYRINGDNLKIELFVYNLNNLKMLGVVTSEGRIENINVMIKDLEFKLLTKLDILLEDKQKANLCLYDVGEFSKSDYSLYFSKIFLTEDVKELKYRMQFSDTFSLISNYYQSLFEGLMENKIRYNIKFYGDDALYNIYSTESVNDSTFFANVLNDNWTNKVGVSKNLHSGSMKPNSKMVVEIDYNVVQAVRFDKGSENFMDTLKQISIYSLIVTAGFLLAQFL